MKIFVTGVAGYIGGQTAIALNEAGYEVDGVDIKPLPDSVAPFLSHFYQGDFCSGKALDVMVSGEYSAIVHCAGTSLVGPSTSHPQPYWHNNVGKTLAMLDNVVTAEQRPKIVFSSSASVYGDPVMTPCQELDITLPISVYGQSKLAIEWFLNSYATAYGLEFTAFRYFNAAGADQLGRHGQPPGATHIIARILESIRDDTIFTINGRNYDTKDGTCVRDYVHVQDVAEAHVIACQQQLPNCIYNLGSGQGHSNLDIVKIAEQLTGRHVKTVFGEERSGDPPVLVATSDLFQSQSSWKPKFNITDIIETAWKWYQR